MPDVSFEGRLLSDIQALERASWDEAEAVRVVEAAMWPDGPVCPTCGRSDTMRERTSHGYRSWTCATCGQVRRRGFLEGSRLPLRHACGALLLGLRARSREELRGLLIAAGRTEATAERWSARVREVLDRQGMLPGPAPSIADIVAEVDAVAIPDPAAEPPPEPELTPTVAAPVRRAPGWAPTIVAAAALVLAGSWIGLAARGRPEPPQVFLGLVDAGPHGGPALMSYVGDTLVATDVDPGESLSEARVSHEAMVAATVAHLARQAP